MSGLPRVELALNPEDAPFFAGLERGELLVPWCESCDDHVWPPRSICAACYQPVEEWRLLAGSGTVYSFSVVHRGEGAFASAVPYVFALVALDGGPTIMSNVVADPSTVRVGLRVRLAGPSVDDTVGEGGGRIGVRFVPE